MPVSKAQQRAVAKYMKENYEEIKIRIPKGQKAVIQEYARALDTSVNGLIVRLIEEEFNRNHDLVRQIIEGLDRERLEREIALLQEELNHEE